MAGPSGEKATQSKFRWLGVGLSLNRVGFGLLYLLRPAHGGRGWIGRVAGDPGTTVIMRGHGARDVVLGCGALSALAHGDERVARAWLSGQVVADMTDFGATLAVRERLPRRGARFALSVAGASMVAGSVAALSQAG